MTKLIDLQHTKPANTVVPLMQQTGYWMETVSGRRIDILSPDPQQICIDDVAWALSRLPRFCGHSIETLPLTVASHSIWVGIYLWEKFGSHLIALHGLLHDAHEAFMGDIPFPIKQLPALKPEIQALEERLQRAIYTSLNLPLPSATIVHAIAEADRQALASEARFQVFSGGKAWELPAINILSARIGRSKPDTPEIMFKQFTTCYGIFHSKLKQLQ